MRNKYSVNSHNHNRSIYSKLENVAKTFYNVENFLQRRSNIILTHCARWNVFGGPQTRRKGPLSGMRQFLTAESRLNLMKRFYFTLKTLLIFICRDFVGHLQKWLDKKSKVNFKILNVKNWEQIITVQILSNISRSKSNQL